MKVSYRTFKISWNVYFLNFLCQSRSHGRHLIDSSIALFSKSLTLPDVYAFIPSKLPITLMSVPWLGAAFYTETAHECPYSPMYKVRHAGYVVSQFRPLDSRVLKCWLQLGCHPVIWESIICRNTEQTAVGELKTIQHILQMYSKTWSSMLALDRSSLISFRNGKRTGNQPHWKGVEHRAMPNFDPYSKQWPTLWTICSLMSIRPKLN